MVGREYWFYLIVLGIFTVVVILFSMFVQTMEFTIFCEHVDNYTSICEVLSPHRYKIEYGLGVTNLCYRDDYPTLLDCVEFSISHGDCEEDFVEEFYFSGPNKYDLIVRVKCKPTIEVNLEGLNK